MPPGAPHAGRRIASSRPWWGSAAGGHRDGVRALRERPPWPPREHASRPTRLHAADSGKRAPGGSARRPRRTRRCPGARGSARCRECHDELPAPRRGRKDRPDASGLAQSAAGTSRTSPYRMTHAALSSLTCARMNSRSSICPLRLRYRTLLLAKQASGGLPLQRPTKSTVFGSAAAYPALRSPSLIHARSEEHTSELQSLAYLVCRLLLEKKKKKK